MKNTRVVLLCAFVALVISVLACGGDNTGEKVDEVDAGPTSAPPTLQTYGVGDVIQVGDHTIVLNSAGISGDTLKANFTIENKGAEDITVSSMLSFEAKDSEGTKLDQEIFDCGSALDGSVLAGDKLKGDICWSGATTPSCRIYYKAELFGSGAVVWEVEQ